MKEEKEEKRRKSKQRAKRERRQKIDSSSREIELANGSRTSLGHLNWPLRGQVDSKLGWRRKEIVKVKADVGK